jgi:glycosyltransferase involved in cell wall biosynthesis
MSVVGGGANLTAEPGVKQAGRVLFVGKEFHRKGGDLLLAAHEALRAEGVQVELDIVTDARFHDLSRPAVSWHDRPTDDALCALYAKASVFVMASRFETWGDALIEAMHAGCACVVADLPPLDEIVDHGASGVLFEPASAKDLTDCLHRLLASENLVGKLGQQARHRALERFSWDVVAAKLAAKIRSAAVGAG